MRRTGHDDLGDQVSTARPVHSGAALEALRKRRDLSISDLESDLAISRFGVVKHLVVLQRSGAE